MSWIPSVWSLQAVVAHQSGHAPGHRGQPGSFLHLPRRRPSVTGPQRREPAQRTSLQRLNGAGSTRGNGDRLCRATDTGTLIRIPQFPFSISGKKNIKGPIRQSFAGCTMRGAPRRLFKGLWVQKKAVFFFFCSFFSQTFYEATILENILPEISSVPLDLPPCLLFSGSYRGNYSLESYTALGV